MIEDLSFISGCGSIVQYPGPAWLVSTNFVTRNSSGPRAIPRSSSAGVVQPSSTWSPHQAQLDHRVRPSNQLIGCSVLVNVGGVSILDTAYERECLSGTREINHQYWLLTTHWSNYELSLFNLIHLLIGIYNMYACELTYNSPTWTSRSLCRKCLMKYGAPPFRMKSCVPQVREANNQPWQVWEETLVSTLGFLGTKLTWWNLPKKALEFGHESCRSTLVQGISHLFIFFRRISHVLMSRIYPQYSTSLWLSALSKCISSSQLLLHCTTCLSLNNITNIEARFTMFIHRPLRFAWEGGVWRVVMGYFICVECEGKTVENMTRMTL